MDFVGANMKPTKFVLYGFTEESINSECVLSLPIRLGTHPRQHIQTINFVVVDFSSFYNAIIGFPTLNAIWAISSTYHLLVKFPTVREIGILKGQQVESHELYEAANKPSNVNRVNSILIGSVEVILSRIEKSGEPNRPYSSLSMPNIATMTSSTAVTNSATITTSESVNSNELQALGGSSPLNPRKC